MAKGEHKVRMRQRLPVAIKPKPWLDMVMREKPPKNRLGAMITFDGALHVAAYLGRQVHLIPVDKAGLESSLWASLEDDDRQILAGWLDDLEAGLFDAEAERARAAWGGW